MQKQDASCLEEIMRSQSSKGRVIAVASGKGGVGKTNIAVNLSLCLAASDKRTVLFDADLGLGNVDVLLNINNRYNLWHFINSEQSLSQITNIGPAGLEVICGASGLTELADLSEFQRSRLISELDELQKNLDFLILDIGAGLGKSVTPFCLAADTVLVVATPEPTSMTDAYAFIKVLSSSDYKGRISLIINMAQNKREGKQVYRQIADVAMKFLNVAVYEAGIILKDDKVAESVRMRKPFVLSHPKSRSTSTMAAMTARLTRDYNVKNEKVGFFRKVVDWFI